MADTQLTDDILPPGYHGCRSQMLRARRQHQPALPKDRHSVDLSGAWSLTSANQSFLLHQDSDMLIFTTDENLKILAALDTMYMDVTFKSSPHLYQQIYSLHGSYRDHIVPLVNTLLSTKSRQSYHTMCSKVRDRMTELDLVFNPATTISDFESAIIPAMRHLFPASQHHGCYFHHTQAVWRQVQTTGLKQPTRWNMRSGDQCAAWWHWLSSPSSPSDLHLMLCDRSLSFRATPHWLLCSHTSRRRGWMETFASPCGIFTMQRCSQTTKLKVGIADWTKAYTELTLHRARLGAASPSRRPQYQQKDEMIQRQRELFQAGALTGKEYITAMRRVTHTY